MTYNTVSFSKYVGAGNDFICIDDRSLNFPVEDKPLIQRFCHRQFGIGADGLVLLQPSARADFKMRIFNSNGSEAEMCGNGLRCLAQFCKKLGFDRLQGNIETLAGILRFYLMGSEVAVEMSQPHSYRWHLKLPIMPGFVVHFLNTGVPHAVHFHPHMAEIDIEQLGKEIRFHPEFQPDGANANFASIDPSGEIWCRTYERGVEAETLACGTGATAAALAAAYLYHLPSPIRVHTRSKEVLTISFTQANHEFSEVRMRGPSAFVYEGTILLNSSIDF